MPWSYSPLSERWLLTGIVYPDIKKDHSLSGFSHIDALKMDPF